MKTDPQQLTRLVEEMDGQGYERIYAAAVRYDISVSLMMRLMHRWKFGEPKYKAPYWFVQRHRVDAHFRVRPLFRPKDNGEDWNTKKYSRMGKSA